MNYLGHLVLSGQDDEVLLGNFMADAVKGSSYKMYSTGVQEGILLHRKIDDFLIFSRPIQELESKGEEAGAESQKP